MFIVMFMSHDAVQWQAKACDTREEPQCDESEFGFVSKRLQKIQQVTTLATGNNMDSRNLNVSMTRLRKAKPFMLSQNPVKQNAADGVQNWCTPKAVHNWLYE